MDAETTQAGLCFQQAGVLARQQGGLYARVVMASKKKTGETKSRTAISKRVREAMLLRNITGEAELLRLIHEQAPGDEFEDLRRRSLTQQMLNHLLNGEAERSYFTPFIAAALRVSPLWLGWGIGPRIQLTVQHEDDSHDDAAPRGRRLAGSKSG